jgi:VIT1/CCC1 family predicted Fe2+/Mn2+ transporter
MVSSPSRDQQESRGLRTDTSLVTIANGWRLCRDDAAPYSGDVTIESVSQRATGALRGALSRTRAGSPDRKEAIFGSFDGMTSTLGVVAGLLAAHATPTKILAAAIGIAVAATTGMSAGQYLSDGKRNLRKAMVMGVATLIGSVLPALPFIFGASLACILSSIAITITAAGVIGYYRGYAVTYLILLVVATLTVGLSIVVA